MFNYLTVALLAVAAPLVLSEPSGYLTIGGPFFGPGYGGYGAYGGYGYGGPAYGFGYGYGGPAYGYGSAVVAAPASVSVQKTVIAHPAPAVAVAHAPVAVAAPAIAIPSPAAATVVAGPSGIITAKQTLAGTVATVQGPASINTGHGYGHGDYHGDY